MPRAEIVVPAHPDPEVAALLQVLGASPGDVLAYDETRSTDQVTVLHCRGRDMLPLARELVRRLCGAAAANAPRYTAVVPEPPSLRAAGPSPRAARRASAVGPLRLLP